MRTITILLFLAAAALALAGIAATEATGHFSPLFIGAGLLLWLTGRAADLLCRGGETT